MKLGVLKITSIASLAVIFGTLYWDTWMTEKEGIELKEKNRIVSLAPENIQRIEINAKQSLLVFERNGKDWTVTEPVQAPLDSDVVEGFVQNFADYRYKEIVDPSKKKLNDFGLAQPKTTVTLRNSKDHSVQIAIGDQSPVGYSIYLTSTEVEGVLMGSQHIGTFASKSLVEFRDREIKTVNKSVIKEWSWSENGRESIEFRRNSESNFEIHSPIQSSTDLGEVDAFLSSLTSLRAAGFNDAPSDDLVKLMSGEPTYNWTWKAEDGTSGSLDIMLNEGKLWARLNRDDSRYYELDEELKSSLRKQLFDFRDRRVFAFRYIEVEKVRWNDREYTKNEQGEWSSDGEQNVEIGGLLVDLAYVKTHRFLTVNDSIYGPLLTNPPAHRLALTFPEQKTTYVQAWEVPDEEDFLLLKVGEQQRLWFVLKSTFDAHMGQDRTAESARPGRTAEAERKDGAEL